MSLLFNVVVVVLYVLRIIWKDERGSDKKNKSKLERMKNQWHFLSSGRLVVGGCGCMV
jgi:heme/copper-type cytochrome/quinol oxidase subunit 3